MSVTIFKVCSYSDLAPRDASLIMQSHALSLLTGKCMEIVVQSIPEKNPVVEFHGARSLLSLGAVRIVICAVFALKKSLIGVKESAILTF